MVEQQIVAVGVGVDEYKGGFTYNPSLRILTNSLCNKQLVKHIPRISVRRVTEIEAIM